MKHQKNVKRIIACALCLVMVATLLPIGALAVCSCKDSITGAICGKPTIRDLVGISPVYSDSHTYIDPVSGCTSLCNYTYCMITEAEVCPDGHQSNFSTYRHEHNDHTCQRLG